MVEARDRIIVAMDMGPEDALRLAERLAGRARWLKVGMTLFYDAGPAIVRELRRLGFDVFLDLKLHDIPHQVRGAAETVSRLGVQMLTVHAGGGADMVRAAVQGAAEGASAAGCEPPVILGVTVLTSMSGEDLHSVGVHRSTDEQVRSLAGLAVGAGARGVVCSPREAGLVRESVPSDRWIVTPGVRPIGSDSGDQSRIATPSAAFSAGASHIVVGRPITAAPDPVNAFTEIVEEIEGSR